eukprot:scaffold34921_cov236-Isochrysis_galbana.AAC.10
MELRRGSIRRAPAPLRWPLPSPPHPLLGSPPPPPLPIQKPPPLLPRIPKRHSLLLQVTKRPEEHSRARPPQPCRTRISERRVCERSHRGASARGWGW